MEDCPSYGVSQSYSLPGKSLRQHERKEAFERKKTILLLVMNYLRERNLCKTADCLASESQLANDYEICDNVDMDIIFQEYQSYYYAKFNRMPKIIKPSKESLQNIKEPSSKRRSAHSRISPNIATNSNENLIKTDNVNTTNANTTLSPRFHIDIKKLANQSNENCESLNSVNHSSSTTVPLRLQTDHLQITALPLFNFDGYSTDWREMAEQILKETIPCNLGVGWRDCIGLDEDIESIKEAVVYPMMYPDLFTGLTSPWKGILLYGPPGTGKTLLAKAAASETKTTFINVTSSTFISKWRGDSEKLIKVLFDVARFYAPTTIFIDELDALVSRHEENQHGATKRFKSELLIHMDGILGGTEQIFVLATTNKPWDLDGAVLRRFERRLLINIPSEDNRAKLFEYFFSKNNYKFSPQEYWQMAAATINFSGSEVKLACKEVCMAKMRHLLKTASQNRDSMDKVNHCTPNITDVFNAIGGINPVNNSDLLKRFVEWHKTHGCS